MKKSELKMMIREVVREEIRLGLKEVIGGIKKQPVQKPKPKQKQNYSKNSVLNEVLNETDGFEEYPTMGEGVYDSNKMGEIVSSAYGNKKPDSDQMVASMGVNPKEVDDSVKNIFTKDYSKLLKTVEKKSKQSRGM